MGAGLVGVLTPHIGRWWFGEVISGLEAVLRPAGYEVVLYPVDDAEARQAFFSSLPGRVDLDALVVVALPLSAAEVALVRQAGPLLGSVGVLLPGVTSVAIDERSAARSVVEHLVGLGHARIALVSGDPQEPLHFTAAGERRRGYVYALHERGLWPDPGLDVPGYWTIRGGVDAARRLLRVDPLPTAVFAISDEMAIGVLHALRADGVRVPEDLSVVGFDDHPDAEAFGLTTVYQPAHDCGARLAAGLVTQLAGRSDEARVLHGAPARPASAGAPAQPARHVLNDFTRLVVRTSTGVAAEPAA